MVLSMTPRFIVIMHIIIYSHLPDQEYIKESMQHTQ